MHRVLSRTMHVALLFCALCLLPAGAAANSFDLYGAGSRTTAMGNAGSASGGGFAAVYHNPAAMLLSDGSVGMGLVATMTSARVALGDRPDGFDVPDLGTSGPAIGFDDTLRPRSGQSLGSSYGMYLGATNGLGFERFRFGVIAFLPLAGADEQVSVFNDERERFFSNQLNFELLGGRVQHQVVMFASAYQVTDWLSLGLGASYMPAADTTNFVYVDNVADFSVVDLDVGLKLASRFRPNAGVLISPSERTHIGLSFRDVQFLRLTGENEIQVRGLQGEDAYPFIQTFDLTLQYSPRTVVGGFGWETDAWSLAADLRFYQWSAYRNNQSQRAGFVDTLSPRLGAEYRGIDRLALRAGFEYEPSPVGDTSGRHNYVDNDRFVASIGAGHTFPLERSAVVLNWHAQVHLLAENTVSKRAPDAYLPCTEGYAEICDEVPDDAVDPETGEPYPEGQGLQTGNTGFPGFSSGGVLAQFGVEVAWEF